MVVLSTPDLIRNALRECLAGWRIGIGVRLEVLALRADRTESATEKGAIV